MKLALLCFTIGLLGSVSLLCVALFAVAGFWKKEKAEYTAERVEKACDSVTSFVAFLIPATLVVTTWVYEKTGTLWYGAFLALSTLWFLVVLVRTMYMRFNFVWRFTDKIKVGQGQSMEIPLWLTTVMVGLTVGLVFLAIPTFVIAFRTPPLKEGSFEAGFRSGCLANQNAHDQSPPDREKSAEKSGTGSDSCPKQ